jgi:hypothetical protein
MTARRNREQEEEKGQGLLVGFIDRHTAGSVAPSPAAQTAITALLAALPLPNPSVYGAQGSAALAPGYNLHAYASRWGHLPPVADKQAQLVSDDEAWRGLGTSAGPLKPSYSVEPLHFRIDAHLVIAETHPDDDVRRRAHKQAGESVALILKDKVCTPGAAFTNPRGFGWTMRGLRNWWLTTSDPAAAGGWGECMAKLSAQHGCTADGQPYLTLHPSGADHGHQFCCVWMTGIAGAGIAEGVLDSGGYGVNPTLDALASRSLACLVWAEQQGSGLTGLPGRLCDDYIPLDAWLKPGYEAKYGVMARWAYPAARLLAEAGVPGAVEFLQGPITAAWEADEQMRPAAWKVGNGYGAMHAASIAAFMAPVVGWK